MCMSWATLRANASPCWPPSNLIWLCAAVLQVVTGCISQQVDLLEVLGQLAFSLPEPGDAAYEAKATAAVEALLKDMEVAQVRQGGCQEGEGGAAAAQPHRLPYGCAGRMCCLYPRH
jgi:hypothetical protein